MSYRKRMLRHGPRTGVLAASIGAIIATGGLSGTAWGQDGEDEDEESTDSDQDTIVVTGTRIRRDDFSSPNAMVTVTADDMRNLGVVSVAEMINQLPGNVADITPETSTDSTFNSGASIANMRGLNANSGTRTLVLVDSRRVIGSSSSGAVDLNMIPTALVGRIETVTGGASATYGADAMAGVVNVILDNNVQNTTVDLSYEQTSEGDGQNLNMSIGTGFEVLDRRGSVTVGYDRGNQDGIDDCTQAREICRTSYGVFQNGSPPPPPFFGSNPPYTPLEAGQFFPGQPQYVITEGFRYARPVAGYMPDEAATDPGDLTLGTYTFSEDGRNIMPMYDDLTQAERDAMFDAGEGPNGTTPFGQGKLAYAGVPLRPDTTRDNLYTRFAYDFEGGLSLSSSFTFGKTETFSRQNSSRQSYFTAPIFPENAFLSPEWGASQPLRDVIDARLGGDMTDPVAMTGGGMGCAPAPYFGDPLSDTTTYDFHPTGCYNGFTKDISDQVGRFNTTNTEQWSWDVAVNGDLFEGGSWTWDASLSYGESERFVDVEGWQSSRRLEMAMNSLWDPAANGGAGAPVCAVDHSTEGAAWEALWLNYIDESTDDTQESAAELQYIFDTLSGRNGIGAPCAPFNPFGEIAYPGSLDFAFPSITDATNNTQTMVSLVFSGDAWRGFGNAGPVRMAAGVDFRLNETDNGVPNVNDILDRDFGLNFSDDWNGETETSEAFVEFDVPLLRDKPGADQLMVNLAYRYTDNTTRRLSGAFDPDPDQEVNRSPESWKASLVWRPVDMMTVRMTRSTDTRAPSAEELFEANRPALQGSQSISSPFRRDDPATPGGGNNEQWEDAIIYSGQGGGNPSLTEETAVTQTLGLVFQPVELLTGLSVSVDYYETLIDGGINTIGSGAVANRCLADIDATGDYSLPEDSVWCDLIVFDTPDPADTFQATIPDPNNPAMLIPNPGFAYTNIGEISGSSENSQPFLSRGIDISINYNTQLGGGGFLNARVLASRALEQRVTQTPGVTNSGLGPTFDVSGQTGSQGIGSIWSWAAPGFTNYTPTPRISGNAFMTYSKNAMSITGQVRYVGSGDLTNQTLWLAPGDCGGYYSNGGATFTPQCYDNTRGQMVTYNELPSWTTLNLNFEYDFARSAMQLDRFEGLSVFLNIDNVGDRVPDYFTGNGTGAQNNTYFSILGRTYRMGMRMTF